MWLGSTRIFGGFGVWVRRVEKDDKLGFGF